MHGNQMSAEEKYVQLCNSNKIEPLKEVISALNSVATNGELNLSSTNLNALTWQILAKVISLCNEVRKLNFGNCLIPPRGIAALLAALSQGSDVQFLELRGNNIQTTCVTYLGKMLRHNVTLKRLSLEWNNIGVFIDTFNLFCDGLGANQSLEVLDLRNNQLSSESAPSLANSLTRNKTLKTLDLRWNNLGWKGGQLLYTALSSNQSLTKVKLQGNCIPMELILAIEQCATHNDARASILQECAAKTSVLARQLKKVEEERSYELRGLARQSEEKLQHIVRASEVRIGQMENILLERESALNELRGRLKTAQHELKYTMEKNQQLVQEFKDKSIAYQDALQQNKKELEELQQNLVLKDEKLAQLQLDMNNKMATEQKRRVVIEAQTLNQAGELSHMEAEGLQLKEKLNRERKLHETMLFKEQEENRDRIAAIQNECEARVKRLQIEATSMRTSLHHQIQELQQSVEDAEKTKTELSVTLARERSRREEEVTIATQETRAKESCKISQLEEKLIALRDEKLSLEKQLSMSHSTVVQLQQQNTSLISELTEPQRKLTQMHEELSSERQLAQRVRQELLDENLRFQAKKKDVEQLQAEVEKLQLQLNEAVKARLECRRELEAERAQLVTLMEQRDRQIESIRADEMERAGVLYSAFNKYLGSLSPSKLKMNA